MLNNSRTIIFIFFFVLFISCKKSNPTSDLTPKISFFFNGKTVQYSGKASGIKYDGVALIGFPLNIDSSQYQYEVLAGTNDQNFILLVFNGSHPLQKSNINQISYLGITYAVNGTQYACVNSCNMLITIDANNLLTGTFNSTLTEFLPNWKNFKITNATFENVVLQ
jgi:hypothetical protein